MQSLILREVASLASQRFGARTIGAGRSLSFAVAGPSKAPHFTTSASKLFASPTKSLRYPRWINTRGGKPGGTDDADDGDSKNGSGKGHEPQVVEEKAKAVDSAAEDQDKQAASRAASSSSSGDSESDSESSSSSTPPSDSSSSDPDSIPPSSASGSPPSSAISKQSVPEIYPQVLALPITRRPLFPGFYKAVVIRHPGVVAAIKEMMKRGQPYLGAFLLKDEDADSDVITDIDSVHRVGVFAQITSVFPASGSREDDKEESITAVLYPHRRIRITELITPSTDKPSMVSVGEVAEALKQEETAEEDAGVAGSAETPASPSRAHPAPLQTSFLHDLPISLANVENLVNQPYQKSNQYIRATMSEIVSVFKDIAQLNPLFRDQITNFTIS
ncbi:ATP-dependent Lon protease pim1, partial [Tulasnella sp. 408]